MGEGFADNTHFIGDTQHQITESAHVNGAPQHGSSFYEQLPMANNPARTSQSKRALPDRRTGPRRLKELQAQATDHRLGQYSIAFATVALGLAIWCLTHSPVSALMTQDCVDAISRPTVNHRSLSNWWLGVVILAVLAAGIPEKRRPALTYLMVGTSMGLGVAAYMQVGTWSSGLCLA